MRALEYGASELRISGYASLFGQVDMSGDIVQRGAFAASLLSMPRETSERIPMLFGHETTEPIGVWDRLFEDRTGLFVSGRLIGGNTKTNRTARLIREGALSGLSIGYRAKRATRRNGGGRNLLELDLWEVSVVAFPMLRSARITQIDNLDIEHEKRKLA
ncbi:HK97 family phage prohead protease [Hellea sp.]|nr:HK97 family phage prohead protease [Hellea sp.]